MSALPILAGLLVALVVGFVIGRTNTIRRTRFRERLWLRMRCHEAAVRLQRYFASPVILLNMLKRAQGGHHYDRDPQFRRGLEETLHRAFDLDRGDH